MLKTRILTAVVLLAAFFLALFFLPQAGWLVFATLIAALAAGEWGGLLAFGRAGRIVLGAVVLAIALVLALAQPAALGLGEAFAPAAWQLGRYFYLPAAAFWLIVAPLWLTNRWRLPRGVAGALVGLFIIVPTWLALVQLRLAGPWALLALMATVWVADSGAYFVGRSLGRHKLAPSISPGKTWEGAIGGGVAVVVYGMLLAARLPEPLSQNRLLLLALLVVLTAISVVGDLYESLLKRQAGLKDSSNLLPGHGGVLDRIDSLCSTLPLAAIVWLTLLA